MRRYALFAGDAYEPVGGWQDFKRFADTLDEARPNRDDSFRWEWWHVVDMTTGRAVAADTHSRGSFNSYLPELADFPDEEPL